MRWMPVVLVMATTLVSIGCIPDRFAWSGDKAWMTVLSDDGLRIADAEGNLQPGVISDVRLASWFPDSRRLLISRRSFARTWERIANVLSIEQTAEVTEAAKRLRDSALAYNWRTSPVGWKDFLAKFIASEEKLGQPTAALTEMPDAVALCVRDKADDDFTKAVSASFRRDLQERSVMTNVVESYRLGAEGLSRENLLLWTLHEVRELRVSPTGNAALIVVSCEDNDGGNKDNCKIGIVATNGAGEVTWLLGWANGYPDWTPDGHSVVYMNLEKVGEMGRLTQMLVVDDDGKFVDLPFNLPEPLAYIGFEPLSRVRCLRDGRVFFSARAVSLPATISQGPGDQQLFSIGPEPRGRIMPLTPPGAGAAVGNAPEFFQVNPDATRIAVPGLDGTITIIDLAERNVFSVQDKPVPTGKDNGALMSVPDWRSNDELTFLAPGAEDQPTLMLWSISQRHGQTLSARWPKFLTSTIELMMAQPHSAPRMTAAPTTRQ